MYHVSVALIGVDDSRRIMGPPTIREEVIGMYNNIHLISYVRFQLKWGGRSGGIRVGSWEMFEMLEKSKLPEELRGEEQLKQSSYFLESMSSLRIRHPVPQGFIC